MSEVSTATCSCDDDDDDDDAGCRTAAVLGRTTKELAAVAIKPSRKALENMFFILDGWLVGGVGWIVSVGGFQIVADSLKICLLPVSTIVVALTCLGCWLILG